MSKVVAEPVTPTEDEMLQHVASQTGLVLRNLRLIDDLRSSRQRLVSTADDQRRRPWSATCTTVRSRAWSRWR